MKSRVAKPFLLVAALAAVVPAPVRSAERPVVGVVEFENLAGGLFWWRAGTGNELAGLLSDRLAETDTLSVMSRLEVADAQAGSAGTAGVGRYLVRPAISYYHEQGGSRSSRIRIAGVHIRGRLRGAEIAAELEVTDLATGTRLHSGSLDSRTGGLDLDVGYYEPELSGELSQYRDKPAGKAITKLIAAMADEIERVLAQAPPPTGVAVASSPAVASAPGGGAAAEAPVPAGGAAPRNVSANYDFVPGDRTLFADDLSDTPIGDFPHRLRFKSGEMEVVEWNGRSLLRAQGSRQDHFEIPLPETLPERFTLEFEIYDADSPGGDVDRAGVFFGPPPAKGFSMTRPGGEPHLLVSNADGLGIYTYFDEPISSVEGDRTPLARGLTRIEVQVDGEAVKVYADGERIANVPSIDLGRHDAITFLIQAQKDPTYIGNLRVAAGGSDLYSALRTDGRVTARDILFETGSARLRSASTAALAQIAAMLEQHPELRLRIEGHTDDTNSAESNLVLSQERADAVRDHLVAAEGIDPSRLEAVGMGEEHPVADNGTEAGRAKNRRVELVSVGGG